MLLVVERMHAAAQHFAVIDFQRPVVLTDVLIPPCESLSSLSVYAWKEHQTENEAVHVVTYNEISEKILILTDIIPSIKCRYLKVFFYGVPSLGVFHFSTYAWRGRGSSKSVRHAYKGGWGLTHLSTYAKKPLFAIFFIFSRARYFYHASLSLVTTFITVL